MVRVGCYQVAIISCQQSALLAVVLLLSVEVLKTAQSIGSYCRHRHVKMASQLMLELNQSVYLVFFLAATCAMLLQHAASDTPMMLQDAGIIIICLSCFFEYCFLIYYIISMVFTLIRDRKYKLTSEEYQSVIKRFELIRYVKVEANPNPQEKPLAASLDASKKPRSPSTAQVRGRVRAKNLLFPSKHSILRNNNSSIKEKNAPKPEQQPGGGSSAGQPVQAAIPAHFQQRTRLTVQMARERVESLLQEQRASKARFLQEQGIESSETGASGSKTHRPELKFMKLKKVRGLPDGLLLNGKLINRSELQK